MGTPSLDPLPLGPCSTCLQYLSTTQSTPLSKILNPPLGIRNSISPVRWVPNLFMSRPQQMADDAVFSPMVWKKDVKKCHEKA